MRDHTDDSAADDGLPDARLRPRVGWWALGLVCLGVVLAGGLHVWWTFSRRTVCGEADAHVRMLFDGVVSWSWSDDGPHGRPLPASAGPTPARWPSCVDGRVQPVTADWRHPTWVALGFRPTDRVRHRYSFTVSPDDPRRFTVRALGDLDCDGEWSTFERVGRVDPQTREVEHVSARIIDRNE